MNLINDAWIPVLKTDGSQEWVTPAQTLDDRVLRVAFERADWNAAVTQFLVALMQTAIIHKSGWMSGEDEWFDEWDEGLGSIDFCPFADAFDQNCVFQDIDPTLNGGAGGVVGVTSLLPDMPGDNARKKNSDLFVWRERLELTLTESEIAAALITTQMLGVSWGGGFYNGPRGSGSVSTLIVPDTQESLWRTIWLNVLPYRRWIARYGEKPWDDGLVFPWLSPTADGVVTPDMAHPLTVYWAVSKTMKLVEGGFVRRKGGRQYQGWKHPLTPYRHTDKGVFAVCLKQSHVGYDHWMGLTLGSGGNAPAAAVNEFVERRPEIGSLRLWVHGWHVKQTEHHAWVEQMMPLVITTDKDRMVDAVEQLVAITDTVQRTLARHFKALRLQSSDSTRLYDRTEAAFYTAIKHVSAGESISLDWLKQMRRTALGLFDEMIQLHRLDLVTVAAERAKFTRFLWGDKLEGLAA